MFLFSSWQAEVCQRCTECGTLGMRERGRGQDRETAFLQTCSKQSHTRETDSFHSSYPSDAFLDQRQKKAASVREVWQSTSGPPNKTFILTISYCGGHRLVEQLLRKHSTKSREKHKHVKLSGNIFPRWLTLVNCKHISLEAGGVIYIFLQIKFSILYVSTFSLVILLLQKRRGVLYTVTDHAMWTEYCTDLAKCSPQLGVARLES